MADVASAVPGGNSLQTGEKEDGDYVFFHSGSEATFRKVSSSPTSFTSIPVIDLADIDGPLDARKKIAAEIYDACANCGFFYIKNHGVSQEVIDETFATLKRFFALDLETKMTAHVQKNPAIRGYEPMGETRLDPRTKQDLKESFTMGDCPLEPEQSYTLKTGHPPPSHITRPQNIWLPSAPWWREGLYNYYSHILPLTTKLIHIFALAFSLPETGLDHLFTFPITGMRALHYPPSPSPSPSPSPTTSSSSSVPSIGLGAHADFSWLTLVLQDSVPALEVLNQSGQWIDAPPMEDTFVCNVGQYLERMTGGKFMATVHRVRNRTGGERFSLPFFLTMDEGARAEVLERFRGDGEEEGEVLTVGDLYIRRVLPARPKHPTSMKYRDVPQGQWRYDMLLS